MHPVRTSAKAIILKNNRLLVLRNTDKTGPWYNLPGGGQELGETLPETLRRECLEEIGTEVTVGPLRYIREYIGARTIFAYRHADVHQIEFMFLCEVPDDYTPISGEGPDTVQSEVCWMGLSELGGGKFHPWPLIDCLINGHADEYPVYLGDID